MASGAPTDASAPKRASVLRILGRTILGLLTAVVLPAAVAAGVSLYVTRGGLGSWGVPHTAIPAATSAPQLRGSSDQVSAWASAVLKALDDRTVISDIVPPPD